MKWQILKMAKLCINRIVLNDLVRGEDKKLFQNVNDIEKSFDLIQFVCFLKFL